MSDLHCKIGKLLKLERERQSLTLEDLCAQLKIPKSNLEHIEAGEVDALPSELYFNLFAKSYAETLGIDYSQTVEVIKEDIGEPLEPEGHAGEGKGATADSAEAAAEKEVELTKNQPKPGTKYLKTWVVVFGVVIILFLILVLVNKFFLGADEVESPTPMPANAASESTPAVKRAEPTRRTVFARYNWDMPPYQEPPELQLKLVAKQKSWATVLADGDTAIYDNLVPGKPYKVAAKYHIQVLSIGVPSAVDFELNNCPVNLRNPSTGRIPSVEINQANLDSFLSLRGSATNTLSKSEDSGAESLSAGETEPKGHNNPSPLSGETPGPVKTGVDSAHVRWEHDDEP